MGRYDYRQRSIGDEFYGGAQHKKKTHGFKRVIFLLATFVFVIALFVYVFPEVQITIVPATEAVENNFDLTIKAGLQQADYKNNVFPAKVIEVEDELEKTFPASGEKNIGDKASGEAVFFNQTGLVQPLTTANSLVTDNGIIFYVQHNIDIPKAEVSAEGNIIYGNISVPIIAAEAGEQGNVGPGRLTITDLPFSKQNKIYAEIKTKLSGGTNKVIQVVSEEDLDQAQKTLIGELKPKLKQALEGELLDGEVLNGDLLKYETVSVEKAVELDEQVKDFKMKIKMKAQALVWNQQQVKEMVLNKIKTDLTPGKRIVKSSQDVFRAEIKDFNLDKGTATLKIFARNQVSLPIKVDELKDKLKGLKEYEARRLLLSQDNIKDVRFKFRYSLTSRVPKNGNRIDIKLAMD